MKILSFDIEDWFHILDLGDVNSRDKWDAFESRVEQGVDMVLSDLDDRKLKATFFCLGWVAEKHPSVIKKISNAGHHIGSHSYSHDLVYQYDRTHFRDDLNKSIHILEDLIGKNIDTYRAPGFSVTSKTTWYVEEIVKAGIKIDSSIFPAERGHGGFPSFGDSLPSLVNFNGYQVKEFPINLASIAGKTFIFSGGGYFRLLPVPVLKYFFSRSDYVMTYFHMRDFDNNQPILNMSKLRKFKSYYGIGSCWKKYKVLLDSYNFIDLKTAETLVDWSSVKTNLL